MDIKKLNIGCSYYVGEENKYNIITLTEKDFENIIIFKTKNRLKPIELTKDFLLKLGFVSDNITHKLKFNGLRFVLFQINASNNYNDSLVEFTVTLYQNKQQIEIARLKYVHQLQNLYFALTDKKLTL